MRRRLLWLLNVGTLPLLAVLATPAARGARPKTVSRPKATKKKGVTEPEGMKRFDQPGEAQQFYLRKRSPDGKSPLDASLWLNAALRADAMPRYSTLTGQFLPSKLDASGFPQLQGALGTWTWLGPGNVGGRTRALVIDPSAPSTMFAGGVAGGVWKTTNGGGAWSPIGDLLANIAITTLAMDPANSLILYAGTGEGLFNGDAIRGAGIFKTTDGGASWAQLPATTTSDFFYVNKLVVSPVASNRLYAATRTGIWRSTDSGTTWTKVQPAASASDVGFTDLVIRTDQPTDWLFAAEGSLTQGYVRRNVDAAGAGVWELAYSEAGQGRASLALAPSNQSIVYALMTSTSGGNYQYGLQAVIRSTTGGASGSWSTRVRNTDPTFLNTLLLTNARDTSAACVGPSNVSYVNQGWYDSTIAVDPMDPDRVWAGGVDIFRSVDGGSNWQLANYWWAKPGVDPQYAHADNHAIVFHPQYDGVANQTMFVASDGGVSRTDNAVSGTTSTSICPATFTSTVSWTRLNNGYGVTQFYDGAVYPGGTTFFGGTQDNGTIRGAVGSGPNSWNALLGGDGGYVAVDPTAPTTLYAENVYLSLQKSTDGGATFNPATNGITEAGGDFLFIAPFAMDPSQPQNLWTAGYTPFRTTNGAGLWQAAGAFLGRQTSAIAVCPTDSNRVVIGSATGAVSRSTSALTSTSSTVWAQALLPGNPFNYVSWVAFDPVNPLVVYATVSTFGYTHVWKSADGGASWNPLVGSGATGLPDIPVHCLVVDPANTSRLYVGTDLGVFVSVDGGGTWYVENSGFANVPTEYLSVNGGMLYAFTHGRGVYRVSLCSSAPTAAVSGGGTICPGGSASIQAALTGTGPWSVTWSDGTTQSGIVASPAQRTVSPGATAIYTVTALQDSLCPGSSSGSATVTVSPTPATPVVTAPDTVLSGASGYAASTSQVPGAAYAWSITNGTITSGAGTPSITFSAQAAGPLQLGVTVTSGAGCVSAQGTKTVTVLPVGFFALTPCRLFDTRIASGPAAAAPPLQPISTRIFAPTGNCSVPPTAKALSLNVTVTNVAASGYVLLYPSDVAAPTASTISFRQGLTRANNTIVKISSDGSSTFAALNGSPGTVDIIFDVNGYFQ